MFFAICIWGLLRSAPFTFENIRSHIYQPLTKAGHEFDVHMHTFVFSKNNKNKSDDNSIITPYMKDIQRFQPDYLIVDSQERFDQSVDFKRYEIQGDAWDNGFKSMKNHIRALYSLKMVTISMLNANSNNDVNYKYQGVIFMRPDVHFMAQISIQLLEKMVIAIMRQLPQAPKFQFKII